MKKIFSLISLFAIVLFSSVNFAFSDAEPEQIPDQVTIQHWSCKDVAELGKKYDAEKKLPDSVVVEGKPCTRGELATCLLSVIKKVMEKCDKEGADAVPREDLDRIAKLHDALKKELEGVEGYLTLRESIEKMLAKPEEPPFLVKGGVKGFLRGEGTGNQRLPDFSYNPGHSEGRFLYRVMPYVYFHPTDYLDIHVEGQGYGYTGGSQYYGKVSLYQGFVEARLPEKDVVALKVGRQEFVYGSAFILGADGFYKGFTLDAARLRVKPVDPLTVDFIGGLYATPWSGGIEGNLVGGYASYAIKDGTVVEAYAFNDTGSTDHHHGEYRDTWGLRGTAKVGPVSFELEPVYQSGRTLNSSGSNDHITAWGGHADATFETEIMGRRSTIFASYAYGSGNKDAANGISARKEFLNENNDTALTGDMSLIGDLSGANAGDSHASGLQLFNLGWGMDIIKDLNFSATGRYFYANAVPDGFSRNIGLETDFTLTYVFNDNLTIIAGYDHFFTGGFFRDATGSSKDIDYGYLMLQFDISKSWPRLKPGKKG
ncbi:MAG TPA: alginate export family protein [Geobacteraceae bacterium]|nr:alginate export family protein [Geobacteraceae bacterium]